MRFKIIFIVTDVLKLTIKLYCSVFLFINIFMQFFIYSKPELKYLEEIKDDNNGS